MTSQDPARVAALSWADPDCSSQIRSLPPRDWVGPLPRSLPSWAPLPRPQSYLDSVSRRNRSLRTCCERRQPAFLALQWTPMWSGFAYQAWLVGHGPWVRSTTRVRCGVQSQSLGRIQRWYRRPSLHRSCRIRARGNCETAIPPGCPCGRKPCSRDPYWSCGPSHALAPCPLRQVGWLVSIRLHPAPMHPPDIPGHRRPGDPQKLPTDVSLPSGYGNSIATSPQVAHLYGLRNLR
jgi:hypothetical protein